ncbi:MAG: hypothetical protein V4591_06570 [Bdellovibrionota bacterium]
MLKLSLIIFFNLLFLPLYMSFFIIGFFVTFVPLFPIVTAHKNAKERLELTGLKNRIFVATIFLNYVFYLFEIVFFSPLRLRFAPLPPNFVLEDFLKEVRASYPEKTPQGFTFLAAHVANLEYQTVPLIRAFETMRQEKILIIAKHAPLKVIDKILIWHRLRPGLGMIWKDKNLFATMNDSIDKGCSLCLIADQKPKKNGVFIRFFGKFAAFPTAGVKFCAEKKSIFIYVFAHRIIPGWVNISFECGKNLHLAQKTTQANSTYSSTQHLILGEIYPNTTIDEKEEMAQKELAYYTSWLENNIKKYPTQWCWDYGKWSREPS